MVYRDSLVFVFALFKNFLKLFKKKLNEFVILFKKMKKIAEKNLI